MQEQPNTRSTTPPLWGRRLPNFVSMDETERRFEYHRDIVHGPTVFVADAAMDDVEGVASALARLAAVVTFAETAPGPDVCPGARVVLDPDRQIRSALFPGKEAGPEAILADADQRLVLRVGFDRKGMRALGAALEGLKRPAQRERRETAPVMLLPNLLDPDLRQRLIEAFVADNREGLVAILDAEGQGRMVSVPDRKRRRDLTLDRKGPLYAEIRAAIADRLMPELWKAWWVDRLRTEAFYVASYEAGRGDFFAAHRDNSLSTNEHRRIAVSIELNEDYEGGGLVFPEYSDDRWRAPAGGGLAFSCSLLHEAVPVTAGCRYVLLVFLAAPT